MTAFLGANNLINVDLGLMVIACVSSPPSPVIRTSTPAPPELDVLVRPNGAILFHLYTIWCASGFTANMKINYTAY